MNRGGRHERQRREPQSDRGVGGSRVAEGEGVCRDGGDADEERRHAVGGSGERAARHAKETRGVRALHTEGKEGGEEEEVRRTCREGAGRVGRRSGEGGERTRGWDAQYRVISTSTSDEYGSCASPKAHAALSRTAQRGAPPHGGSALTHRTRLAQSRETAPVAARDSVCAGEAEG